MYTYNCSRFDEDMMADTPEPVMYVDLGFEKYQSSELAEGAEAA